MMMMMMMMTVIKRRMNLTGEAEYMGEIKSV